MAGLLDIDMGTSEGQGFNSALMQAAAMLLTPRHRGDGMGAAFAAFPQAIEQSKALAQRNRMLGLQEQQIGLQTAEAQRKAQAQAAQHQNLMRLIAGLPPEQQAAALVAPEKFAESMVPGKPQLGEIYTPQGPQKAWLQPGQAPVPVGAPKPEQPPELVRYMQFRDSLPAGDPMRAVVDQYLNKATTHAPAASTNVYTGTMVPGEVNGKPAFLMPSKDGTVQVVDGIMPPGTAAAQEKAISDTTAARDFINLIDTALAHPGREIATGLSGTLDLRNYIPGSPARSYKAIQKQLEGKAFLNAFNSLKGGGPITDVEGKKATEASVRLDTAQSDEEYEAALKEARTLLNERYKRSTGQEIPKPSSGGGWKQFGYSSKDEALHDARNAILRNPAAKSEIIRRLEQEMGISDHGLK